MTRNYRANRLRDSSHCRYREFDESRSPLYSDIQAVFAFKHRKTQLRNTKREVYQNLTGCAQHFLRFWEIHVSAMHSMFFIIHDIVHMLRHSNELAHPFTNYYMRLISAFVYEDKKASAAVQIGHSISFRMVKLSAFKLISAPSSRNFVFHIRRL